MYSVLKMLWQDWKAGPSSKSVFSTHGTRKRDLLWCSTSKVSLSPGNRNFSHSSGVSKWILTKPLIGKRWMPDSILPQPLNCYSRLHLRQARTRVNRITDQNPVLQRIKFSCCITMMRQAMRNQSTHSALASMKAFKSVKAKFSNCCLGFEIRKQCLTLVRERSNTSPWRIWMDPGRKEKPQSSFGRTKWKSAVPRTPEALISEL